MPEKFYKKNIKEKKIFTTKEKKKLIENGKTFIIKLGKTLTRHAERNKNTSHINRKIFHLFRDPFIFVNAYTKISKNKGALTEGYEEDKVISHFGLEQAKTISKKLSMVFTSSHQLNEHGCLNLEKKENDL
jgi:hypothetical protein